MKITKLLSIKDIPVWVLNLI